MSARSTKDIGAMLRDRSALDRAFSAAFTDAVRRHRQAGVPMATWKEGRVVHVSRFDVPLPEDERQAGAAD